MLWHLYTLHLVAPPPKCWAVIRENMMSALSAAKDEQLSKYCWMGSVQEWFLLLLTWAIGAFMKAFDAALHCLAELQEIERERWRREEEVEDERGAAARQAFLGHGTRKWTSLAWPAGAYSQKVWGYTLQRSKSICLRKKNQMLFFIHDKDSGHKSRFQISAVLFQSPRACIQTSILIQRHTKPLENYTKHTHSAFKEHSSLECSE